MAPRKKKAPAQQAPMALPDPETWLVEARMKDQSDKSHVVLCTSSDDMQTKVKEMQDLPDAVAVWVWTDYQVLVFGRSEKPVMVMHPANVAVIGITKPIVPE